MDKRKARDYVRIAGYECKGTTRKALDIVLSDSEKLEEIEKIITKYQDTLDNFYSGKPRDLLESDVLRDIKDVLEKE